jgi:hypothetical protein
MKPLLPPSIFLAAVAAAAAGFGFRDAGATPAAGMTVDRTLACTVLPAGVGAIQAAAYPKIGSTNASPAQVTLSTGTGTLSNLVTVYEPGVPHWGTGVTLDAKLCRAAKTNVPLAARGLRGGVEPLGAKATCLAARRVFVHLHVVMSAKLKWTSNTLVQVAHGKPVSAEVAVRSQKQKPLLYLAIRDDKVSFFSAKSCF